jgi:hypothetical protein
MGLGEAEVWEGDGDGQGFLLEEAKPRSRLEGSLETLAVKLS